MKALTLWNNVHLCLCMCQGVLGSSDSSGISIDCTVSRGRKLPASEPAAVPSAEAQAQAEASDAGASAAEAEASAMPLSAAEAGACALPSCPVFGLLSWSYHLFNALMSWGQS